MSKRSTVEAGTHPQRQRGYDRMVERLVKAGNDPEYARETARRAAIRHERDGKPLPREIDD